MTSISGSSIFVPLGLQPIAPVEPIPSDDTSNQWAQDDETDRATTLARQVEAFEAYLNQTSAAQAQNRTGTPSTVPQPTGADTQSATGEASDHIGDGQGLLTDLVAFEAYLNGRPFAATQDPIASSSSIPLPNYQTTQGTLNPLPVSGPEQTAKTADAQSTTDKDKSREKLETFLDTAAIANLVANLRSVQYDPVHELESRSTYKPPGESTPL